LRYLAGDAARVHCILKLEKELSRAETMGLSRRSLLTSIDGLVGET